MKTKTKHTPIKLQADADQGVGDYHFIGIGGRLGTFHGHREFADQLVCAVNCHDELLALARNVVFLEHSDVSKSEAGKLIIKLARNAIAKAEGKT